MWREFSLMLVLFNRAVLPDISLRTAMKQWKVIRHRLAEPPRKRKRQCEEMGLY